MSLLSQWRSDGRTLGLCGTGCSLSLVIQLLHSRTLSGMDMGPSLLGFQDTLGEILFLERKSIHHYSYKLLNFRGLTLQSMFLVEAFK